MKRKNIAVAALAVLLVGLMWYQFLYSPMQNDASKAKDAKRAAEQDAKRYEKQLVAANAGPSAQERKAALADLENAIPPTTGITDLLRATDKIRADTGVAFQSITPAPPTASSAPGTINLTISVQGSYAQAMGYVDALMKLPRLVIVDNVAVSAAAGTSGGAPSSGGTPAGEVFAGQGGAPTLQLQITARVFTQAVIAAPGAKGGAAGSGSSGPAGAASGAAAK